ncbi:MAG: elongation factor P [Candidatus Shapirobacteria bacterium]|nr:elongation factor P [Candidatus Shapirobacteria bacterium]
MIPVNEMKSGRNFQENGVPYQVIDYKHTKMGRGSASIRLKVKNLKTGAMTEKTFISGAKIEPIQTETKMVQYLYYDDDYFYFMEPRTFEQINIIKGVLGDKSRFLKEGEEIKIVFWNEEALGVDLPLSLVFKIEETAPGVKGNSVNASFKPAVLDNGLAVKVPLFINVGDKIKVDTRSGNYIERVSD